MRKGSILFICLLLLLSLLLPLSTFADTQTENLESRVLETFDPDTKTTDWLVVGSKFTSEGYPEQVYTKSWPEALYGANLENKDYEVLGIHVKWDRKGYNNIEIIPVKKDDEGNVVPNPIPIPGMVKKLDLWVWCSRFNYYMDVHVRDSAGVVHVLRLGDLNSIGWKNFSVAFPGSIKQSGLHVPFLKSLELVKFVIWTKPEESVSDFYVYLDQVKVLTDLFITRFDGDNLANSKKVQEVWGGK